MTSPLPRSPRDARRSPSVHAARDAGRSATWVRGAHRVALLALAAAIVGACTNVLGLNDYKDAVDELCSVCSNLPDCEASLEASMEAATESERHEWLERYASHHCDVATCETNALECFYTAPGLCAEQGALCEVSEGCCGFDFEDARAGAGCCNDGADGKGTCCETCRTCADVATEASMTLTPDLSTMCLSHKPAWNALKACRDAKCKLKCKLDLPIADCSECVAKSCESAVAACFAEDAP